jgi:hypothetical protein
MSSLNWLTDERRVAGFAWETNCRSAGQEIRGLVRKAMIVEK